MCYYLHMYVYVITCTFMLLLAQCVITCAGVSLSAQVCFYLYRCVARMCYYPHRCVTSGLMQIQDSGQI